MRGNQALNTPLPAPKRNCTLASKPLGALDQRSGQSCNAEQYPSTYPAPHIQPQEGHMKTQRIVQIDSARGIAMMLVFTSHFSWILHLKLQTPRQNLVALHAGMVASPAFIIISGIIFGMFYHANRPFFAQMRSRLWDRALFLLTVTHLLLTIAHYPLSESVAQALRWSFMTDTIGISIILASFCVHTMSMKARFFVSLLVYFFASWLATHWHIESIYGALVKETLFGSYSRHHYYSNFPIAPWFSLYLMATCLGQFMQSCYHNGDQERIGRSLLLLSAATITGAAACGAIDILMHWRITLYSAAPFLDVGSRFSIENFIIFLDSRVFLRYPPTLGYFLLYTGLTLFLLNMTFRLAKIRFISYFFGYASMIGRTSLFNFVIQYFVYYFVFYVLPCPKLESAYLLYFIISILFISTCSYIWDTRGYNHFIGFAHLIPRTRITRDSAHISK